MESWSDPPSGFHIETLKPNLGDTGHYGTCFICGYPAALFLAPDGLWRQFVSDIGQDGIACVDCFHTWAWGHGISFRLDVVQVFDRRGIGPA